MESSQLNNWMQVGGIFALVASLIFVGLQMKQNQDIAIASQYQARAEATLNLSLVGIETDWVGVRQLRDKISETVSARGINQALWLWIQLDNHFYQYEAGFLDEDAWQAQLQNVQSIYVQCDLRFVWDWRKSGLRADFVELVESGNDPCKGELQQ